MEERKYPVRTTRGELVKAIKDGKKQFKVLDKEVTANTLEAAKYNIRWRRSIASEESN